MTYTLRAFLRDRALSLALLALCLASLYVVLSVLGVVPDGRAAVLALTATFWLAALGADFLRRRRWWRQLEGAVDGIPHARYIKALVPEPTQLEASVAYRALDTLAGISADELAAAVGEDAAYRRYVELWSHETKTPIAAAKLVLGRMHGPDATALRGEVDRLETQVEQILFYSRTGTLSGDYSIRAVDLAQACREACRRNANLLLGRGTVPRIEVPDGTLVLADKSWLLFVLGQLLSNSAKYGSRTVRFSVLPDDGAVLLELSDDGAGIPAADMARIFERGFVGENGRAAGSATGMGLYICARICQAMDLSIDAFSEVGVGTRIVVGFPLDMERLRIQRMEE